MGNSPTEAEKVWGSGGVDMWNQPQMDANLAAAPSLAVWYPVRRVRDPQNLSQFRAFTALQGR